MKSAALHVYLAGAMEYAPDRGCGWRAAMSEFLSTALGHTVFNPCVEEQALIDRRGIPDFRDLKARDTAAFRRAMRDIIDLDLAALRERVDYVVCLWDEHVARGAGTHGELTLAYLHGKPVYLVTPFAATDLSSWVIGCSSEIYPDFTALKADLLNRYGKR